MKLVDQIAALERVRRTQENAIADLQTLADGCLGNLSAAALVQVRRNLEALDLAIARLRGELS